MHDLFHARAGRSDLGGEISETAGAIADHGGETAKAAVGDEAAFDDPAQDIRIDVAAAKQKDNALVREFLQLAGETRGERSGGRAFDDGFFQFDETKIDSAICSSVTVKSMIDERS